MVAICISDLALISIIPAMDSYWASRPAKDLALKAKERTETLDICYVLSNFRRGAVATEVIKMLRKDADQVDILGKGMSQRNAFSDCQVFGTSVHNLPKVEKAVEEIEALVDAVTERLKI